MNECRRLFDEYESAALARFPNTEVAPRILWSLLQVSCPERLGAVSLLRRACGVPQHLELMYDISDALEAPALASTWPYDSVSRFSPF